MRGWVIAAIRAVELGGCAGSVCYVWALFGNSLVYAKMAYSVPNPNPIYQQVAPVVGGAVDGFLSLAARFLIVFVLSFSIRSSRP